ncbi:MAG: ADP-heptose:LPS heptosyltransferase [Jatrophihabitantaceae bacterium]|nr:ADP-heptose:LPS heptosyltransferase [Jatrophihabitantaceae bacterium]
MSAIAALSGGGDGQPAAVVLRALGLGDLLTAVPALRGIRAALPAHRVVLAAPARWGPLAALMGCVDALQPLPGIDATWPSDIGAVDVAINLHGSGPQSHDLLARLSPRDLVGFACPPALPVGARSPAWSPDEHEVGRWCRLIDAAFGAVCDPADLRIARPPVPRVLPGPYAILHPGAASVSRRWPVERFAQVGAWLREQGVEVLVTAGPDEAELGSALAKAIGARSLIGAGIPDLCAAVSDAALVVCGDTGIAHLASAYGRPSVVLFGPVSPALWGPPPGGPHTVLWDGDGTGDPHGGTVDPALLRIDVDRVLGACARRLRSD